MGNEENKVRELFKNILYFLMNASIMKHGLIKKTNIMIIEIKYQIMYLVY